MNDNSSGESSKRGEVLPPDDEGGPGSALNQHFLALVSNYTDRPDLLIAEIEKHDPGFVKRMNEASERDAEELRAARFHFGRTQAYVGLGVAVLAAIVVLGGFLYAIHKGLGFWPLIGITIMFAVTQGGSVGFHKVIDSLRAWVKGPRDPEA